jgi:hypothetical protein
MRHEKSGKSNRQNEDVDDFWKDCIENNKSNTMINEKANEYITCKFNIMLVSEKSKSSSVSKKSSYGKFKGFTKENFEKKYRDEQKEKQKQKSQNAVNHCFYLYERGKIKNEVNRILYHKNEELKQQSELQKCTFIPKVNKLNENKFSNLSILLKNTKIYNRTMLWKYRNNDKITKNKGEIQRETIDHAFSPQLNNSDLNIIFDNNKTVLNDMSARGYIVRQAKAREVEVEKKKRLENDLGIFIIF